MKNWLTEHPYAIANVAFVLVAVFGRKFLVWGPTDYAFLLMLYLVVIIGIRLDDIRKQLTIAKTSHPETQLLKKLDTAQASLEELNRKVEGILERLKT